MSTSNKVKQLEQRRERLISELLAAQAMIRGSFGMVHRNCGASNCWCAQAGGHPVNRINYSDEGRSRATAVRAEDVKWARQMIENCKRDLYRSTGIQIVIYLKPLFTKAQAHAMSAHRSEPMRQPLGKWHKEWYLLE